MTEELATAESNFSELSGLIASANRDAREQSGELEELNVRIQALEVDRTRQMDAIKLRELGSQESLEIDNGHCPTCEQLLPPSLQVAGLSTALTLEENKSLIDEELKTFKAVRADATTVLSASRQRQSGLHGALTQERRRIRTLKGSLTQSPQAPSHGLLEVTTSGCHYENDEAVLTPTVARTSTLALSPRSPGTARR